MNPSLLLFGDETSRGLGRLCLFSRFRSLGCEIPGMTRKFAYTGLSEVVKLLARDWLRCQDRRLSISEGQIPRRLLRLFQSKRASVWTGVDTSELAPRRPALRGSAYGTKYYHAMTIRCQSLADVAVPFVVNVGG